ncbi:hypothetical protein [Planctomycetes bacterium SV_7m_r]
MTNPYSPPQSSLENEVPSDGRVHPDWRWMVGELMGFNALLYLLGWWLFRSRFQGSGASSVNLLNFQLSDLQYLMVSLLLILIPCTVVGGPFRLLYCRFHHSRRVVGWNRVFLFVGIVASFAMFMTLAFLSVE